MNQHLRSALLAVLAGMGAGSLGLSAWLLLGVSDGHDPDRLWMSLLGGHALLLVLGAAAVVWLHRRAFAPLSAFASHVAAIGRGDLSERPTPPQAEWTELARSLNVTVAQLREQFAVRDARLDQMHGELTVDGLTGLPTRAPFRASLEDAVRRADASGTGTLVLVRVRGLATLNVTHGREHVDEYLRLLSQRLKVFISTAQHPQALVARLNGTDFGLVLPGLSTIRVPSELDALTQRLHGVADQSWADMDPPVWIGASTWRRDDDPTSLLERTDALLQACEASGARWRTSGPTEVVQARSAAQWRDLIDGGLDTGRFWIDSFEVQDAGGALHHREVVLRLHTLQGEVVTGAELLPAAIRSNRTPDIDLRIVELALARITETGDRLAVSVSRESVARPNFLYRLDIVLSQWPEACARLIIQVDAVASRRAVDDLDDLLVLAAKHRVATGVDRYVGEAVHLAGWVALGLGFVKLRPDLTRDLHSKGQGAARRRWLHSFLDGTRAMGLDVIATGIQSREDLSQAFELGVVAANVPALGPGTDKLGASRPPEVQRALPSSAPARDAQPAT